MPRNNTLPRISIPVVINEPQRQSLLALADRLNLPAGNDSDNQVILLALRDLFVKHFPAIPNPFNVQVSVENDEKNRIASVTLPGTNWS